MASYIVAHMKSTYKVLYVDFVSSTIRLLKNIVAHTKSTYKVCLICRFHCERMYNTF